MYLVIFEDGDVNKVEEVSSVDLTAADSGYLDVINISEPKDPVRYWNGKWVPIDDIDDIDLK